MPNARSGDLGPGWRRGAAKDKALLQGELRGEKDQDNYVIELI